LMKRRRTEATPQDNPPFPVRVAQSRICGRQLRTTCACARGDVLLRNLPFALVPCDAQLARLCARCLSAAAPVTACERRCGLCLCSACAVDPAWRAVHAAGECVSLQCLWSLLETQPGCGAHESAGIRLLLRVVYASQLAGKLESTCVDGDAVADGPESLTQLLSHWETLPDAAVHAAEGLAATARRLLVATARSSRESLALLAARLACNAFDLVDAETGDSVGEGLYPSIAVSVNHSCAPTADFVVEVGANSGALALRALRPLAAGEAVTVSYCNAFSTASSRRQHLKEAYLFMCRCQRCVTGAGAAHVLPLAAALRTAVQCGGRTEMAAAAAALAAAVQPLVDGGDDWARLTLARARWAALRAGMPGEVRKDVGVLASELALLLGASHPFVARVAALESIVSDKS